MRTSGYHVTSPDFDGEVIHDCDVSRCRCRIPCHHDARQPFTSEGAQRYAAAMRRGNAGLLVAVEPCECFAGANARWHVAAVGWGDDRQHDCPCGSPCHHDARKAFTRTAAAGAVAQRVRAAGALAVIQPCDCDLAR